MRQFTAFMSALLFSALVFPAPAQNIITTIAGTDVLFPGDGKAGLSVPLGRDAHVTVDPQGRAVFSDSYYNVVVRVEADDTLHVLAGNNVPGKNVQDPSSTSGFGRSGGGFSGDNGPATSAALSRPRGVAYDLQGNLYIADSYNNRIRVVNPSGTISTFAGSGTAGFQDGPAGTAQFNFPLDITVDSAGAVIVNDAGNRRIRKISQGRVTTIAGGGQGAPFDNALATSVALGDIEGLAADSQGNVYFSDFGGNKVFEIIAGGRLLTIAGNGAASNLFSPSGLAVDGSGAIYVTVTNNQVVRKIVNGTISTIAGNGQPGFSGDSGPALRAALHNPFGVAVSAAGNVYIADRDNFRIRRIDTAQNISTIAGNGTLVFSSDGKQAIYAPLLDPFGVTLDSNGSLLIADTHNNVVRSIDPSGTLSTIAGNGAQEDGDENLPATQVGLGGPVNANRDASGNLLIADIDASLVRQVSTKNIITDFAGMPYAPGNSGNGKPATSGTLLAPSQAVRDSNGNTYIADFGNGNIRVVGRDQIINLFKSGLKGPFGLALDNLNNLYVTEYAGGTVSMIPTTPNAPATTVTIASGLVHPAGIAVDAARNVYVADAGDNRVRKLTPSGSTWTISTVAGNGQAGYSGDGGIATSASLRAPFGVAVDSKSGAVYIADTTNNRVRAVQNIAPGLSVSTSSLTFTVNQGGTVSDVSTVDVTASSFGNMAGLLFTASSFGNMAGLLFTASASQPWISVSPALGATPATLQITVDPSGLTPKTYNESITISAPGANPPAQKISITVTVNAPPAPDLTVDTDVINAGVNAGGPPVTRQIRVLNRGGQQPQVAAVATMQSGTGWLSVSPGTGVASAIAPAGFNVTIAPGNLAPGAYVGQILVTSGGKQIGAVPVNIAVNAKPGRLVLSSNGLSLTAVKGGGAPLAKTIDIVNAGTGSLAWKATGASLTANTPNWLSLDASSGSLDTAQTSVSALNVSVNPGTLGIGTYYGQIQITSDSAANSPQFVTVVLNVVDPTNNPGPDISAAALVFPGVQGVNPSSQTVRISNLSSQALAYGSTRVSEDGDWIVHVPTDASIAAGQTARIVVQPDFTNLGPGSHRGTITLRFSDNTVRTIDVLSIVAPGASTATVTTSSAAPRAGPSCSASSPLVEITSLQQNFSIFANQATPLQATVSDCSGRPVSTSITVRADFSGGLPALYLKNAHDVLWTADWAPSAPAKNLIVQVTAYGLVGSQDLRGQSGSITGTVTSRANSPAPNSLKNAASFVAQSPVAPGALVSIFGSNLANTTAAADKVPLNSSLAGATITLAGRSLPIVYASDTQINAQLPYDLTPSVLQLAVQRDDTLSPQVEFVVGRAQPGIFTENQMGYGQGVIVFANTVTYANVAQPAKSGDFLTIYCTGLGPVQGNVVAGAAVSGQTPTIDTATVTIGDINATVLYAGLTPGFPGLYQVNVQVPAGVSPGDAVPVAITISGQTSPPVTIAVR